MAKQRTAVLICIDGWGVSSSTHGNAIAAASTPVMDAFAQQKRNYATLDASGLAVGLPKGVMGNSDPRRHEHRGRLPREERGVAADVGACSHPLPRPFAPAGAAVGRRRALAPAPPEQVAGADPRRPSGARVATGDDEIVGQLRHTGVVHRTLLCDGPRQALGAHRPGVARAGAGRRRGHRRHRRRHPKAVRQRRDRRVPQTAAVAPRWLYSRWRYVVVLRLPRRPHAADRGDAGHAPAAVRTDGAHPQGSGHLLHDPVQCTLSVSGAVPAAGDEECAV
eukprot:ctg_177.g87